MLPILPGAGRPPDGGQNSQEVVVRIGNLDGRVVILTTDGAVDIERASGGQFGPHPQSVYEQWAQFTAWAAAAGSHAITEPFDVELLDAPSPAPRQAFGIGLNYRDHAQESGLAVPDYPSVFTKFPSCITGPHGEIALPPDGHTDWEVELVAVIGTAARNVAEADAWSHVAGLTAGQDISERITQLASAPPQFSMGKSFPRFGPTGPWLVTMDEFATPDDLELGCAINGEEVQKARTSLLIISVPQLIAKLSAVLTLLPGDVIFTGTPAGVGMGRSPQRWLAPGDELVTWIEGIGEMRHRFIAG
jgi:2-keto-4-pentenoate hydratase/2-oxohepta-3-ene-1,7-dioic acid hydratase in catechol pathway